MKIRKCPVCGREHENFGIKGFSQCPKTTLFGRFKAKDADGCFKAVDRKLNAPVCSEECKRKNEERYFVEDYKGNKIYCVDGRYMPYLECDYWYDNIDGVKNRIDNPRLIPSTPNIIKGLCAAMSGEPGNA